MRSLRGGRLHMHSLCEDDGKAGQGEREDRTRREREAGQRERHALALRPRGTGLGDGAEWPLSENGCLAWGIRS